MKRFNERFVYTAKHTLSLQTPIGVRHLLLIAFFKHRSVFVVFCRLSSHLVISRTMHITNSGNNIDSIDPRSVLPRNNTYAKWW